IHRITRGDWACLPPDTTEYCPFALVRRRWRLWGESSMQSMPSPAETAFPAAMMAEPCALINTDSETRHTTLMPRCRAPWACGAHFANGAIGDDDTEINKGAHCHIPLNPRQHHSTTCARAAARAGECS